MTIRPRRTYTDEFKKQMVLLYQNGKPRKDILAEWDKAYKETGKGLSYGSCSAGLPALKKQAATEWLKEVDSIALQSAVRHLSDAYDRFFKQQNHAPRFKSKRNPVQSYTTKQTNGNIAIVDDRLKLPKLESVKFTKSREVEGRIMNATIRRNPSGNYYVSILCEVDIQPSPKANSTVGVDVGLKDFAILSDGTVVYENPKFFRSLEKKLAKEQCILSRRMEQAHKEEWYGKEVVAVAKNFPSSQL